MYDSNYENDYRVRARRDKPFDEQRMLLTYVIPSEEDEDEEEEISFPAKFEVCDICNGKGQHVNPSIDCHGLTSDDFAEDPDFAEGYFSGRYDVACYCCHGQRVMPVVDEDRLTPEQKKALERLNDKQRADAEFESECRHERIMGY